MPFCICVNEDSCIRLTASNQAQLLILDNVESFYIPNEHNFKADLIPHNALTYFWTYRDEGREMYAYSDIENRGIGRYKDGEKEGLWTYYYPDHTKEMEVTYTDAERPVRSGSWCFCSNSSPTQS